MLSSVAIVGSCQIGGIGHALKRCSHGLDVRFLNPKSTKLTEEELVAEALAADAVVTQDVGPIALHAANLAKKRDNVHFLPMLVFRGFHADCTLYQKDGKLVPGVLGNFHSTIASSSYALGLPESQTAALFNTLIYRALGYFEAFELSRAQTLDQFAKAGYDIRSCFERWNSLGQFMYTPNHPRIEVLMDLGEQLAHNLGTYARGLGDLVFNDNLRNLGVWPRYPEPAKSRGADGSLTFGLGRALGERQDVPLATFVAESYRMYSGQGRQEIRKLVAGSKFDILQRLLER
jgi:hypothetical protein